ncbi:MAG: hypothetical protein AB1641_03860 [Thermodesulfobacteriota bacterium]
MRAKLTQMTFSGPGKGDPEVYRKNMAELEEAKNRLEAKLAAISQAFALKKKVARADRTKVAASLPANSMLLEFVRLNKINFQAKGRESIWLPAHYLVFVLRAGSGDQVGLVDLGETAPVDQAVADLKKAITDAEDLSEMNVGPAAHQLHDLVFVKIKEQIGPRRRQRWPLHRGEGSGSEIPGYGPGGSFGLRDRLGRGQSGR